MPTSGVPAGLADDLPARPWALKAEEVAGALGVDAATGLSGEEVAGRLRCFGPNELVERARKPAWRLLAEQFANTMIVILLLAAVVTVLVGDLKDTLVILAIVVLNGLIGYAQEHRAERAMAALRAMTVPTVRVLRAGLLEEVPAAELVPGDVVQLATGDVVAADLRLVEAQALRVNEAALTGESQPVFKTTDPLPEADPAMPAEQRNLAFRGTAVAGGRGAGVVVATGMATELGRLAEMLQRHPAEPTPLQRRLAVLGRRLAAACLVVCAVVFGAGVARGQPVEEMFLTAVSLAVAAIPEGLPAVVTIALALGARRMARRRALVRKLPAVDGPDGGWVAGGDPTEAALLALAGKLGVTRETVEREHPPVAEVGFDAARRRMTTLHRAGDGVRVAVKGAVDALLPLLRPDDAALARRAEAVTAGWAADGYRLLALAERRLEALPDEPSAAEDELRLLG